MHNPQIFRQVCRNNFCVERLPSKVHSHTSGCTGSRKIFSFCTPSFSPSTLRNMFLSPVSWHWQFLAQAYMNSKSNDAELQKQRQEIIPILLSPIQWTLFQSFIAVLGNYLNSPMQQCWCRGHCFMKLEHKKLKKRRFPDIMQH